MKILKFCQRGLRTAKNIQSLRFQSICTNAWVSAYVGRVNDYILFRYDPNDAYISQVDNINATIMGGEAGVSYKLTDSWKTDASLAYSWGRNTEDGNPLPQMPPLEARLGLSWESGNRSSTGLVRLVSCYQRCKTDPPQWLKIDPGVNLLL